MRHSGQISLPWRIANMEDGAVILMPVEAGNEVMDRLRRQTSHWPKKIEANPLHRAIAEGKATREGYVELLRRMWAFQAGFESRVTERREWDGFGFEFAERTKVGRLERDLAYFEAPVERGAVMELPLEDASFGFVCGYLYVIESATMVGQNQFRILSRKLGIGPETGGAFLNSYGDKAGMMWRGCQDFLERVGQSRSSALADMIAGANDAYLRLEGLLKEPLA